MVPRLVPYPSLVGAVHQGAEVLHPAIRVWVLEQDPAHVLPTEVHLVGQLEHGLHPDVAGGERGGEVKHGTGAFEGGGTNIHLVVPNNTILGGSFCWILVFLAGLRVSGKGYKYNLLK